MAGIESAKALAGAEREDGVNFLMRRIEELAEVDYTGACILMIALWPIASEAFMHDICDAIDLWIVSNPSSSLLDYLRRLSQDEPNHDQRRHWDSLAASITRLTQRGFTAEHVGGADSGSTDATPE